MTELPIDSHCARCLRPAPQDDDPASTDWEALTVGEGGGELIVCPDYITPEEQQAMDEAAMAVDDELILVMLVDDSAAGKPGVLMARVPARADQPPRRPKSRR